MIFFVIKVLFVALVVMENKFALEFLSSELLFVFLGHGIEDQVEFISVVDRHLSVLASTVGLQNEVDDPVPQVSRGVTVVVLAGHMQDELGPNFAETDGLDLVGINPPFDFGSLQIVDCSVGDEETSLLLLLVVVELEDRAAHEDCLSRFKLLQNGFV